MEYKRTEYLGVFLGEMMQLLKIGISGKKRSIQ